MHDLMHDTTHATHDATLDATHDAMSADVARGAVLRDALACLLPAGVACAGGPIARAQGALDPAEAAAVASAVERRRAEFRAGRTYARRAMALLGEPPRAVPALDSRAPCWPAGLVGSITHDATHCLAAVARGGALRSLGIDLERDEPLERGLVALVAAPRELAQAGAGAPPGADLPKLLFVIKEAAYKAYWPVAGRLLDFGDLDVRLHAHPAGGGRFEATLASHCPPAAGQRVLHGRFTYRHGYVIASASTGTSAEAAARVDRASPSCCSPPEEVPS